jgi:hypothetical protein
VLPKSLGGTDDQSNVVSLTTREHFICHALLVKMTEGKDKYKMVLALAKMKCFSPDHERYVNARLFEFARQQHSIMQRDPVLDVERRKNISAGWAARTKKKILSAEHKRKIAEAGQGRLHTDEYKAHMSHSKSQYWADKKASGEFYSTRVCPCGISGRGPNMSRYHFANCKGAK